jgi:hypothetical protein
MAILPLLKRGRQCDHRYVFAVYCPGHRSRVLLFPDNIDALVNRPEVIELHWRCTCGASGVKHLPRSALSGMLPGAA